MQCDTRFTPVCDRDAQGDEFLDLVVQNATVFCGFSQGAERLGGIRDSAVQIAQFGAGVVQFVLPAHVIILFA